MTRDAKSAKGLQNSENRSSTTSHARPARTWTSLGKLELFLGRLMNSDEAYVGTSTGGVVRVRAIDRVQEEARWDREWIDKLTGTPEKPNEASADGFARTEIEESERPHDREHERDILM